jgi:hypothetical protein
MPPVNTQLVSTLIKHKYTTHKNIYKDKLNNINVPQDETSK